MNDAIQVVCGVIVRDDGRVLICKRLAGTALGGYWEFPGGKIERGETPRNALLRELREELHIEVLVEHAMNTVRWSDGTRHLCLRPYWCRWSGGELVLNAHSEVAWCLPQNFSLYQMAPADLPICAEIIELRC